MRKIIHVDMDAFYASVEQRDDPLLRGKPVVVAWRGARSVVLAASYEARRFGVHSAMPAGRAERLCPDAVFVPPDFSRYKNASRKVREILLRHTPLVEPLSLDEAYLDVTENRSGLASATAVAQTIRAQIREELQLIASAGVAPNKFLAKIASDWKKPDGLFVIRPAEVLDFLSPLTVARLPGVGPAMNRKLAGMGIATVVQLRAFTLAELTPHFGKFALRLAELASGIDEHPVCPDRPLQSVSAEDTFEQDLPVSELVPHVGRMTDKVWLAAQKTERVGHTVVLKLKTHDFRILTRSHTPQVAPASAEELARLAIALLDRIDPALGLRFRLVGVGLGNFRDEAETPAAPGLFDPIPRDGSN